MNPSLCESHLCLVGRRQSQDAGLGHRQAALLVHTVGHGWPSPNDPQTLTRSFRNKTLQKMFERKINPMAHLRLPRRAASVCL